MRRRRRSQENIMAADSSKLLVHVRVPKPDAGKPVPNARVYLFDSAQRLVQSVPAQERVEFKIDPAQRYRVTVGPDLLAHDQTAPAALPRQLQTASAVSGDYLPQRKDAELTLDASAAFHHWLMNCIDVHGSVRKLVNPGGDRPEYAPICTGTVQVFGIDLACSLDRLSAAQLTTLKNTAVARLVGREIADILSMNFSDFAAVSALAAGLFPLTGAALKSYIVAHRAELAPYMCEVIPEWAICYVQYPDAQIHSDGTFSTTICFYVWQNVDLYFEVVQTVDGVQREVADPDIICTTMFDYDGTQPAVITVTDPAAIACQPDPKPGPGYLYVWPTAIGNVDLREIDGIRTNAGTGLLAGPTPWGGTLPLQMQLHPDLRANNIRYYRWSYRFDGDFGFTQIGAPVTHRWQEVTIGPGGVIVIHLHGYALGPHLVGTETNLFEIPDPATDWVDINDPVDRPMAYFDSTAGATPGRSGMCTLKLEMFNAAGVRVTSGNAGHPGPFKFILPDVGGPPDTYSDALLPNIDANGDLIFRIGVDNNATHAALYDARTGSHGSGDACGIRHYNGPHDPVTIDYAATHPNNFLDWSLSVTKGAEGWVAGTSGSTSSPDPAHFAREASALLGTCVQAAFAVNLYCAARATNGYGRQSQYDRSATMAFALLTP
jgi:hypothetical protein